MLNEPKLSNKDIEYLPFGTVTEYKIDKELLEELGDRELIKGVAKARKEYIRGKTGSLDQLVKILRASTK